MRAATFNAMILMVGLTLVVGATAVHGSFTIDEGMYQGSLAALREGGLAVPGTAGLPPSVELVAFDPGLHGAVVTETPVFPKVPPLYAFLAWAPSFAGYGALFWMNAAAFALTLALLERWLARVGASAEARGAAVAALGLGAFLLEYAQGAWPHCTALALVFGAFVCASARRRGGNAVWAMLGGLLAGIAAGIRYQNVVVGAAIGAGLLIAGEAGASASRRRGVASLGAYVLGMGMPLGLSSFINHVRFGSWNPITKGTGYLPSVDMTGVVASHGWADRVGGWLVAAWSRVVDFRLAPAMPADPSKIHAYLKRDPESGATLIGRFVKKSLAQSAPWVLLGLVFLAWTWTRPAKSPLARELRAASLVVVSIIGMFALAGPYRTDGFAFNQRYLIELLPFVAVAVGAAMPRWDRAGRSLALGLGVVASYVGWSLGGGGRELASMVSTLPLVLGGLLCVGRVGAARWVDRPLWHRATWAALGLCVGWGLGIHLGDDMVPSRAIRSQRATLLAEVGEHVAPDSALFAYWGNKDPYGPMQLTHRTLVIDPWPDRGETSPALVAALKARGQRVYVIVQGMPPDVLAKVVGSHELAPLAEHFGTPLLAEVR